MKQNLIFFKTKSLLFRYEIKYSPLKYIETTERGLVVITVNEADGGRYDCFLGGSLLCSYSITVDAHRYDNFNGTGQSSVSLGSELLIIIFEMNKFHPLLYVNQYINLSYSDVRHHIKAQTIRKYTQTGAMSSKNTNQQ